MTARTKQTRATKLDANLQEALKLLNKARVALGAKPLKRMPKGVPGNPYENPAALAINMRVLNEDAAFNLIAKAWGVRPGKKSIRIPAPLLKFMRDFDLGKYPKLCKRA